GGANFKDTLSGLQPSTKYFYRVRTFSKRDTAAWSAVNKFTTEPLPDSAILTAPVNRSIAVPYMGAIHSWKAKDLSEEFEVEWSSDSLFTAIEKRLITDKKTFVTDSLKPGAKYFWRVRCLNHH